jgi:hypothetical protein
VLGYGLDNRDSRVRFPAGTRNFPLHHRVQNGSGAHPASYPMGTRGSSPGVKRPGRKADHLPPSSAEVKEWVEPYLHSPIRLHGVVLSEAQGQLYFTLLYFTLHFLNYFRSGKKELVKPSFLYIWLFPFTFNTNFREMRVFGLQFTATYIFICHAKLALLVHGLCNDTLSAA